jgi:peroxiredoxin
MLSAVDAVTAILLVARLLLAAVFGVAGVAKLADLAGSRRALIGFGVNDRLAGPLGAALPVLEILVALALLAPWTGRAGAAAALVLLLVLAAGIGWNLARGRSADCHCFGQLGAQRASWKTVARNVLLAAVAGVVVMADGDRPGASAHAWLTAVPPLALVNAAGLAVVLGLLVTAVLLLRRLLRQQAALLERMAALATSLEEEFELVPLERKAVTSPREGLPVGAVAPQFSLPAADGSRVALGELRGAGKPVLLFFVSPSCLSCKVLFSSVRNWEERLADRFTLAVLTRGTAEENQAALARYGMRRLLFQGQSGVGEAYQAAWTPAALLVGTDGRIASQTVYGDDAIRRFVADLTTGERAGRADGSAAHAPTLGVPLGFSALGIGEPAPRFSLPDLTGRMVGNDDLLGSPTLLLFWHPRCGFCQAIVPELGRWTVERSASEPKPIVIATGEIEEVRRIADELRASVLFDRPFDVPTTFGSRHTPSAILLDAEGRVASGLALGGHNVLALVGIQSARSPQPVELASPGS